MAGREAFHHDIRDEKLPELSSCSEGADIAPRRSAARCRSARWTRKSSSGIRRSLGTPSHPPFMLTPMRDHSPFDDPVPRSVALSLDEAFRVLEAIEDARFSLRARGAAPGLQDELATVIRMLHGKLGFDEGGVQ